MFGRLARCKDVNDADRMAVDPVMRQVVRGRAVHATAPSASQIGRFETEKLAEREGIAPSYMTHVLRLTLLAPDIVEGILDGKQGSEVTLARVLEPFPLEWADESFGRKWWKFIDPRASGLDY